MKQNVGSIDRVARVVLGILIVMWGILKMNWWGVVGIVLFATGVVGWCGLY
jgi:hypothetical protein